MELPPQSWWMAKPQAGWTGQCTAHFDVRNSTKHKDKQLLRGVHSPEVALTIARFRAGSATAARVGMKGGLGISDLKETR